MLLRRHLSRYFVFNDKSDRKKDIGVCLKLTMTLIEEQVISVLLTDCAAMIPEGYEAKRKCN